ncbi:MAG: serine--tRNA ligase, partial [Rhodobiaceae bacterium]
MHDINAIRKDPDAFDAGLAKRGASACSADMLALDDKRRAAIAEAQDLQTRRNDASKKIGQAKGQGDEAEAQRLMDEVAGLKEELQKAEEAERVANGELTEALAAIPNLPLDGVPVGDDEDANVEIRRHGEALEGKAEHFEIGEALGMMDFETAAALSGSRFVVLRDALERLDRALGNFMIDLHINEFGYRE